MLLVSFPWNPLIWIMENLILNTGYEFQSTLLLHQFWLIGMHCFRTSFCGVLLFWVECCWWKYVDNVYDDDCPFCIIGNILSLNSCCYMFCLLWISFSFKTLNDVRMTFLDYNVIPVSFGFYCTVYCFCIVLFTFSFCSFT